MLSEEFRDYLESKDVEEKVRKKEMNFGKT